MNGCWGGYIGLHLKNKQECKVLTLCASSSKWVLDMQGPEECGYGPKMLGDDTP